MNKGYFHIIPMNLLLHSPLCRESMIWTTTSYNVRLKEPYLLANLPPFDNTYQKPIAVVTVNVVVAI